MVSYVFLIEYSILTTVICAPQSEIVQDNASEEESEAPDYDPFAHLEQIGDKVFGHPKLSTGKILYAVGYDILISTF